jgi:hypothetical protein
MNSIWTIQLRSKNITDFFTPEMAQLQNPGAKVSEIVPFYIIQS